MQISYEMIGAILFLIYLTSMFLIVHIKKDISIGNFTWGGGVMLLTLYSFIINPLSLYHVLATALICTWGGRLILYVYLRYKKGTDQRYVTWQDRQGCWYLPFALTWIYILNGGFSLVMSLPSLFINYSTSIHNNLCIIIGFLIWICGFLCESIADYQLSSFIKTDANKGKIMQFGLWHYSRHPNYFGEIVMWWGMYCMALAVPYGWLSIAAPIAITTTLLFITGIPNNEKTMATNPEYQEYKKRTSMLIPWWPK
ncbi:MAG: DUF1295 domain-containing protein [Candidatus Dependentiae bacterium]|nr:DUF1295 domain-containing protein [Candidatus Dependentiae bacterium]